MKSQDELTSAGEAVKDLVCGMVKPRSQMKASTVYKGTTYFFCLESDKEMFLANPEHWTSKELRDEKKGVI